MSWFVSYSRVDGGPRRVADERVDVQLVGRAQQGRVEGAPAFRRRAVCDALELRAREPVAQRAPRLVCPEIAGAREPRRAQEQQGAVSRR